MNNNRMDSDEENEHIINNDFEMVSNESLFYLTWEKVNVILTKKKGEKVKLLDDVSGFAKSGECLAIMGGSGAGKSTLLNVLANRMSSKKTLYVEGDVRVNQEILIWDKYKNVIGFVMQRDIFLEEMRVNETFKFTVDLTHKDLSEKEKQRKAKEMIDNLNLHRAENNFVGGTYKKGISGGEKRRLNIGVELLTEPKILFLDEPTSGLDSYTAYLIVNELKRVAREKNMIVIYTIHQPSMDIFNMFDKLMILQKGRCMYFGDAQHSLNYFAGKGYPAPKKGIPVDYFIDLSVKGDERLIKTFNNGYNNEIEPEIHETIKTVPNNPINTHIQKIGFYKEFKLLIIRDFKLFIRTPLTFKIKLGQTFFLTLLFCLMYGGIEDIDPADPNTILDRVGCFFFLSVDQFMTHFSQAVLICKLNSPC